MIVSEIYAYCAPVLAFVVGVSGQCSLFDRPEELHANPYMMQHIYSPNYPQNYLDNVNCQWRIQADWGYAVRLRIMYVDMEQTKECDFDSVKVYDGASESEPLIKEFCDNSVSVIYSTGQYMTITFTTDGSFSRQGFHLAFDSLLQSAVLTARTASIWTTTTSSYETWKSSFNTGALIGGICGSIALIVLCAICHCYIRRGYHQATRQNHSSNASTSMVGGQVLGVPGSTICQNNNAVFMLTSSGQNPLGSAYPLPANYGDQPPPYVVAQQSLSSVIQSNPVPSPLAPSAPPPSYYEAIMLSHVPAAPHLEQQ
ncbi:adhesion G-protein coupled receptor G6-like [Pomacea canaliculata]|uniref:adhesion G-protein coupled receptor G6-like n=1 Tax=Pomacea canaliculata TaxID=400727 RepID=UPI000D7298A8|nr:adhesion G-protein coupled receptor G6-like [Pomacea canaliculata]